MDQRDPGMLGPTEARLEIPEVGICGIDRKIAVFEHGASPPGRDRRCSVTRRSPDLSRSAISSSPAISWSRRFGGLVPTVGEWPAGAAGATSASRAITPSADKEGDGLSFRIEDEAYLTPLPQKLRDVGV